MYSRRAYTDNEEHHGEIAPACGGRERRRSCFGVVGLCYFDSGASSGRGGREAESNKNQRKEQIATQQPQEIVRHLGQLFISYLWMILIP